MLESIEKSGMSHVKSEKQRDVANSFKKGELNCNRMNMDKSHTMANHHIIERRREMPKNAIPWFEESHVIKTGLFFTTGVDIYISQKDAVFIKEKKDPKKVDEEVGKIAKALGHEDLKEQIKGIIDWAAKEHYEKEKDANGDLDISVDFKKILLGNYKIKIGGNWHQMPKEIIG